MFDHDSDTRRFFLPEETPAAPSPRRHRVDASGRCFPARVIGERTWSVLLDLAVFAAVLAGIQGLLVITRYWFGAVTPAAHISRSPRALPLYAFYSVVRISVAYLLSLLFALVYGYVAAYNTRVEGIMVADPRYSAIHSGAEFLAGRDVGYGGAFSYPPARRGVRRHPPDLYRPSLEHGLQFLCLAKSIPRELREAARIYGFGKWQRFVELELPYRRDRPGMEFHGIGGRRLVLPDGLRDVRAGQARFPPAGSGLVPADRRQRRETRPRSSGVWAR